MPKSLKDQVVVLTGASSGIGRAAALEFSRAGAAVALAARSRSSLEEVATECGRCGPEALAVPTDVADPEAVRHLLERAVGHFGRVDVWINNAAVTLFANVEQATPEIERRVIETNLFGAIHGARCVLPHFRRRGRGVLINVGSIVGVIGQPASSAYVASKFGLLGLSKCLRQELVGSGIHVCDVLPAAIDTPLFQHGANHTGRAVRPMRPLTAPQKVAKALVRLARRPKREVVVGRAGRLAVFMQRLAPGVMERLVARQVKRHQYRDRAVPRTAGSVFEPMPETNRIDGGWRARDEG